VAICRQYNVSTQDLTLKWEAFALRPVNIERNVSVPTLPLLRQLKAEVQREFESTVQNKHKAPLNKARLQARSNESTGLVSQNRNPNKNSFQDL
jgi:hypothetical protein